MSNYSLIPLVSISCITYNHAQYIRKCLDGFIMQKTNFTFEVLIHDDASTDGTTEIIKEYERKYPKIIKPIYETENQWIKGRKGSAEFNFPRAKGKYIALCEGDDYWIDPYKLQKQVDFLENNSEFGLSCTEINVYNQSTNTYNNFFFKNKNWNIKYTFEDFLINAWFLAPCTWVIRKNLLIDTNKNKFCVGDLPILLESSAQSKIHYLPESTAVYRVLSNSASHGFSFSKQIEFRKGLLHIQMHYLNKYKKNYLEKKILCRWLLVMAKISFNYRKYIFMVNYLYQYFLCYILLKKPKI